MDPLKAYYIRQGGGGRLDDIVGPVYIGSCYLVQRGSGIGIGSFLSSLFRIVKTVLASGPGAVVRKTLRAGANIISNIANKSSDTQVKDTISNRVKESTQSVVDKLKGRGKPSSPTKKTKRNKNIKRHIFVGRVSQRRPFAMYGCTKSEFDISAKKPVQSSVLGTRVAQYKPIAPVDQFIGTCTFHAYK
jgi:hypothetical protein